MGLRKKRGGLAMSEQERFVAALELDTPGESTGR
jgi:hypothetical protein